jgi:hypothetical protein
LKTNLLFKYLNDIGKRDFLTNIQVAIKPFILWSSKLVDAQKMKYLFFPVQSSNQNVKTKINNYLMMKQAWAVQLQSFFLYRYSELMYELIWPMQTADMTEQLRTVASRTP